MCSISGIISSKHRNKISKMVRSQSHRAPDDAGVFIDENISLGMGRLKIIDLKSKISLPFQQDHFLLCFNGEIYNYIELKKELSDLGWVFKTHSDIEVLLKSWIHWGVKVFDKLNGMYAFSIYDKKKRKLWLARDIAGEKPLYYYSKNNDFLFASELKAFRGIIKLNQKKNDFYDSFQHCLNNTLWENTFQIPAAHYLEYDLNKKKYKIIEYWKFKKRNIKVKDSLEELDYLLKDSIKLRTRSDVDFGLYYSKGLDSSLINTYFNFKNKFFFDDSKNWKSDFFKKIKKIAYHLDLPVGSLSSYPLWKLAEKASKKVKVVITGEGADEIFSGYVRYLPIAREWALKNRYPTYKYLFEKFYPSYLEGFAKITARNENFDLVYKSLKPYFEQFNDPITAMGFADFKLILPSLLQMEDRMAAAFGIENRCPFLDKRIIEFGFSLPPHLKYNNLSLKNILYNLFEKRNKSKTHLIQREKKGLSIRFNKWLNRKDWDRSTYFKLLNKEWTYHYK